MRPSELFRFCPRCGVPGPAIIGPRFPCAVRHVGWSSSSTRPWPRRHSIFDSQGRVLFVRRAKEPNAGKLGVPGGFIDFGESAEEGLHREVREEVGIAIDRLAFLASFPNEYHYREVTYPVVDLYFTASAVNPRLRDRSMALLGSCGITPRPCRMRRSRFHRFGERCRRFKLSRPVIRSITSSRSGKSPFQSGATGRRHPRRAR